MEKASLNLGYDTRNYNLCNVEAETRGESERKRPSSLNPAQTSLKPALLECLVDAELSQGVYSLQNSQLPSAQSIVLTDPIFLSSDTSHLPRVPRKL